MTGQGEEQSRGRRDRRRPPALVGVATFLVGTLTAFCAAWVSRAIWQLGSVELPWGLTLAALSAGALIVLSAPLGRGPTFAAVLGWASGVVLWLVRPGEAVIASDTLGYAFLIVPSFVLLIAAFLTGPRMQESPR